MDFETARELMARGQVTDFHTRLKLDGKTTILAELESLAAVLKARYLAEQARKLLPDAESMAASYATQVQEAGAALTAAQEAAAQKPRAQNLPSQARDRLASVTLAAEKKRDVMQQLAQAEHYRDSLARLIAECGALETWAQAPTLAAALRLVE